jgi:hypothetical protein
MDKDDHGCGSYTEWKKQSRITQAKHLTGACTRDVQPNLSDPRQTQKHAGVFLIAATRANQRAWLSSGFAGGFAGLNQRRCSI